MSGEGMQTFGGGEWAAGSTPDDRQHTENTALLHMLEEGMDVFDQNNDKIGTIDEISGEEPNTGEFYVRISRGLFGVGGDLYLPSSYLTVSSVQGNEDEKQVGVGVPKDQLESMGWDQPPLWAHEDTAVSSHPDHDTFAEDTDDRDRGIF